LPETEVTPVAENAHQTTIRAVAGKCSVPAALSTGSLSSPTGQPYRPG
jgi:hypothetical protein